MTLNIGNVDGSATCTVESGIGVPDGSNVLLCRVGEAAAAGIGTVVPK